MARIGLKQQLKEIWTLGGLSVKDLAKRVWRQMGEDNVSGYAAQLAYYFIFSLFPFFLFLTALLAYIPIPDLMTKILSSLAGVLPGEAMTLVQDNVMELVTQPQGGLLSFGILVALWTASSAVTGIMDGLNRAYGVREGRPFWKVRGLAVVLTVGLAILMITSFTLLAFGPDLGGFIAAKVGLGTAFDLAWAIARWPLALIAVIFAVALVYYYAPDVEQDWKWITPGAVIAVVGWVAVSLTFGYYVDNFGSYNKTYGSIGAVIVLLTWLYLSGLFLLLGGEINSEIEHAAAHGKASGQKRMPANSSAPKRAKPARKNTKPA